MAVTKCDKGHFYDSDKYDSCPHCLNPQPVRRRMPEINQTMFLGSQGKDEKTIGLFRLDKGCDPVVGWLVCMSGKEKGRDYRLNAGRNFLGRDAANSIAIVEDETVNRQNQCSIIYEPVKSEFILLAGQSGDILVDGCPVRENIVLKGEEEIQIGGGTYIFIPFCKEGRRW